MPHIMKEAAMKDTKPTAAFVAKSLSEAVTHLNWNSPSSDVTMVA